MLSTMVTAPTPDPLTPDVAYCEKIRTEVGDGPLIVIKLMRFKPDGGEQKFQEYGRVTHQLLEKARADILYLGSGGPLVAGREDWDLVAVVRYPNIDRFLSMVTDPIYQNEGRKLREEALERVHWQLTFPV